MGKLTFVFPMYLPSPTTHLPPGYKVVTTSTAGSRRGRHLFYNSYVHVMTVMTLMIVMTAVMTLMTVMTYVMTVMKVLTDVMTVMKVLTDVMTVMTVLTDVMTVLPECQI